MRSKGRIEVSFDSESAAKSAAAALADGKGPGRARSSVERSGRSLTLSIEADDVVAFRAALNGLLRNLQVFECIEKNITEAE